jgi:hypothetical protein
VVGLEEARRVAEEMVEEGIEEIQEFQKAGKLVFLFNMITKRIR